MSARRQLRKLIAARDAVMVPGAFDAIAARLAQRAGFEALYVSGAGISNGWGGLPDIELLDRTELAANAGWIARAVSVPVIADADTGFGGPLAVARTVREFERAGLSGIHIEDQESPKRCGHLADKRVIPRSEMQAKIRAAIAGREDPDFVVIARTDAATVEGLDAAIERGRAYAEAGADVVFPEALRDLGEFAAFAEAVDAPLLANMTEFGRSRLLSRRELAGAGYSLVIYPQTAFRVMMHAVREVYAHLRREEGQAGLLDRMVDRAELYELLDYEAYERAERVYYDEPEPDGGRRPWDDLAAWREP